MVISVIRNVPPACLWTQFDERFRHFLLEIYHRRSNADGRLPPSERWQEGAFLPRMPESLEQLDLLLMHEVRARKIRRDGIHFQLSRLTLTTAVALLCEWAAQNKALLKKVADSGPTE
jgi:putative transposase